MAKINLGAINIPKPLRIAIPIVVPVLLLVLCGYLLLLPKWKQIEELKKEISVQEDDIAKSQSMAMKLDILKVENESLKKRLEELKRQLPEEKEVSILLKQVSDKGGEAGLKVISWVPAQKRLHPSKIVYEVPVAISLEASYHRLGHFFSSLTKLDRIVNISDIKLGGAEPRGEEAVLDVSFIALTFTAAEGALTKETAQPEAPK